jgi:hexosaminidase
VRVLSAIQKFCFAIILLWAALPCGGQQLNLMPWPAHITKQQGSLALNGTMRIQPTGGDERVHRAITRFIQRLSTLTGTPLDSSFGRPPQGPLLVIECAGPGLKVQALGEDESYHLSVSQTGIKLTAPNPLGILYGLQTLLQLVQAGTNGWIIPDVQIDDAPRFPWRGLMIDSSRHFMPQSALERNIDGMAAVKLNVLHLHLSDDTGFRVESKKCPRLTDLASDGLYYTQEQIRQLIAYARDRGVRIVPELDVPGHAVDWLAAYPKISSGAAPARLVVSERDTLRPPLDPTNPETYIIIDKVFGEMAALFPDAYFHIGGDEVAAKYWNDDSRIQAWMHAHNIANAHALQTYFTLRAQKIVARYGKHMEGWDKILDNKLPKDSLIQSWRGADSLANSAGLGYKTLLSAGYYLDLMYSAAYHYSVDPLGGPSATLAPAKQANIIGGEACEWAEYATPEILDNRIWPRVGAIAERLWSPASVTDVDSMYCRMEALNSNLEWLGLQQEISTRTMLGRIAGDGMPLHLLVALAQAVEPVKEYDREKTQVYDAGQPLNQLVDAIPPESNAAREVNALATRAILDPSVRPELSEWFTRWSKNDAQIEPYLSKSFLTVRLIPLSQQLATLGGLGLAALNSIQTDHPISAEEKQKELDQLKAIEDPHAEMLIVVAPSVRSLIEAERVTSSTSAQQQ